MKKLQQTTYQCDYCNRKMFGAGAMSRHEKLCKRNPSNTHKCFEFCRYLNRTFEGRPYSRDPEDGGWIETIFTCKKTGNRMYSYKLEIKFPQYVKKDMIRMPLECSLYEEIDQFN